MLRNSVKKFLLLVTVLALLLFHQTEVQGEKSNYLKVPVSWVPMKLIPILISLLGYSWANQLWRDAL